ncbi:MAG: hypothetical protein QOF19_2678 [Alphaproteobacteria bacterium]|jgi:hypothetical protein|nr:hypothetical protein [Alphaproteobacteria bacterium]
MKTHFGYAVIALGLFSGTALAQTTIITREPVEETVIMREAAPIVRERVELTPAQRTTVYRTITKERTVAPAPAGVAVRIGERIPASAQLYAIPESVAVEVPTVKSYKYMVVNNRVVLVDPATSTVVGEIVE